jgi:hypothetical protein
MSDLNLEISQKDYENYLSKKNTISNERTRPDDQDFLDALMSVDMAKDPNGKEIIRIIKAL